MGIGGSVPNRVRAPILVFNFDKVQSSHVRVGASAPPAMQQPRRRSSAACRSQSRGHRDGPCPFTTVGCVGFGEAFDFAKILYPRQKESYANKAPNRIATAPAILNPICSRSAGGITRASARGNKRYMMLLRVIIHPAKVTITGMLQVQTLCPKMTNRPRSKLNVPSNKPPVSRSRNGRKRAAHLAG